MHGDWSRRRLLQAAAGWGAVGLGACGIGARPPGESPGQAVPVKPASVEWLVWDRSDVWGRVAELFNQQTSTVTARVTQNVVNADVFAEKLQATVAAGTAPDVAMSSPVWVRPLVEAKVYQPIDDLAKKEKGWVEGYYPAALDTFRVRGRLYGVWHYANPQVAFYNKELFAQAGVPEPPPDWTYEQWLGLSKRLTKPGDPATAVWGTAAPTSFNYVFNAIRSFGGAVFDDDEAPHRFTGNTPKAVEGLQFLADLLLTHRVAPTDADRQGQGNLMFAGRMAISTEIVVSIGDYRRQMKQSWEVAPVPRGPAGRFCFFGANGTAFTAPGDRDAAPGWTFLKFLGGPTGQRAYLAEFGAVPTLTAVADSDFLRQPPPPTHLTSIVDAMSYTKPLPKLASLDLQKTLDAAFQAIFAGQESAKAAMDEAEGPVNQALRG
jgi:multiple sugar transport system substrate-binding protein